VKSDVCGREDTAALSMLRPTPLLFSTLIAFALSTIGVSKERRSSRGNLAQGPRVNIFFQMNKNRNI
jgi:hypothetical protein